MVTIHKKKLLSAVSLVFLINVLSAAPAKQHVDINAIITSIKNTVQQEDRLHWLFANAEKPEDFLDSAKRAANLTRSLSIAQELSLRLIPALEALLQKAQQQPAVEKKLIENTFVSVTAPVQETVVADVKQAVSALPQATDPVIEKATEHFITVVGRSSVNLTDDEKAAQLRSEIAQLQTREKDRLNEEYRSFMTLVDRTKKEIAAVDPIMIEIQERLIIYRYDLERIARNAPTALANVGIYGKIDGAKGIFLQQMAGLERCCAEIARLVKELQEANDALGMLARTEPEGVEEIQKRTEHGQLYIKVIMKKTEELHRLLMNLKKTRDASIQSKFDLEKLFEAAKAQERKRRRMEF